MTGNVQSYTPCSGTIFAAVSDANGQFVSLRSLVTYYFFFFLASYLPLVRRKLAQEATDPQELQ